ncbi:MAG: PLP-dependent aminotransferase family protein [Clostridia bacterium]|nr:PLP-dependent aminotransferase family protein [Clostridia bacterium]
MKNRKLYMQIYDYYKELIESGKMPEGTRLPSIRRCAKERNVSKTTVEQGYMCLCDDGYILPKSQSGYYVSKRGNTTKITETKEETASQKNAILYDFASSGVDAESFNMDIWRRYLKSALRQGERLLFYGDPQGEYDLRQEIAKYARETRNCVCTEENIVIGAGVQTLLNILCPLVKNKKSVCFDDLSYRQGTAIFSDYGFKVNDNREKSNIIYVSPSYSTRWGDVMSVKDRFDLTDFARKNNKLIIEDDYGSEFRYFNRPTPSLQGLDGGENVVYLGTFSKLLLPSIRISFMTLPKGLTEAYMKKKDLYNQTVSKADQIALCSYIRDGHLNSQIRKSRKIYAQKSKILTDLLAENFGKTVTILKTNSPLYVRCKFNINMTTEAFCKSAEKSGILLIPANTSEEYPEIAFSVATVGQNNLSNAVILLGNVVRNS